jgi:hypothetical protein
MEYDSDTQRKHISGEARELWQYIFKSKWTLPYINTNLMTEAGTRIPYRV